MHEILEKIGQIGIVPVVTFEDAASAPDTVQALLDGGVPCMEITFRTSAAEPALRAVTKAFPEMVVGAGTVLTVAQAESALSAGAAFIVTPGLNAAIVRWCVEQGIPIIPGVMTPTEVNTALDEGLSVLKFFPAEVAGGVKFLKAVSEPFGGIKFVPTGGIGTANLSDYLSLPAVHACGGSWLATRQMIANKEFERIAQLAAEAAQIVSQIRDRSNNKTREALP